MRWHAAVQLIHTEVFHPGSLIQRGHGIGAVEELVMSSLLQSARLDRMAEQSTIDGNVAYSPLQFLQDLRAGRYFDAV